MGAGFIPSFPPRVAAKGFPCAEWLTPLNCPNAAAPDDSADRRERLDADDPGGTIKL
jgi:hypothetical protein